jgi:hypothetical protein
MLFVFRYLIRNLKYQQEGSVVVDGGEGDRFSILIDHRDL